MRITTRNNDNLQPIEAAQSIGGHGSRREEVVLVLLGVTLSKAELVVVTTLLAEMPSPVTCFGGEMPDVCTGRVTATTEVI